MAHPAFRWSRLLPITALLVVTTGVAAAPIRQAWLPIVARPLGLNIGTMPTAERSPCHCCVSETVRRDNVELEAPLTNAPDRLQLRSFGVHASRHVSAAAGRRRSARSIRRARMDDGRAPTAAAATPAAAA